MASQLVTRLKEAQRQLESPTARTLETEIVRLPPSAFFWAAAASMATAFLLDRTGRRTQGHQIARWAAPLFAMGIGSALAKAGGPNRSR